MQSLYFESHVTVDPLEGNELERFKRACEEYGFRVADLVMIKNGHTQRSTKDAFCTTRDKNFASIKFRTINLVEACKRQGIKVRRYKIEDTLVDSKINDEYELI